MEDQNLKFDKTDPHAGKKKFLLNLLWILGVLLFVALISRQFFLGKFSAILPEGVWLTIHVVSFVLFGLGVLAWLVVLGYFTERNPLKDFQYLKDCFQGSFPDRSYPLVFTGEHKGMSFSIYRYSGSHHRPAPEWEIVIKKEFPCRVYIAPRSFTEILNNIFSRDPEILSNDPEFDGKFSVKAECAEKIKPAITRAELKGPIRDIFEKKFGSIKVTKTEIRFWKRSFMPEELERGNMILVMDKIVKIAECLS